MAHSRPTVRHWSGASDSALTARQYRNRQAYVAGPGCPAGCREQRRDDSLASGGLFTRVRLEPGGVLYS